MPVLLANNWPWFHVSKPNIWTEKSTREDRDMSATEDIGFTLVVWFAMHLNLFVCINEILSSFFSTWEGGDKEWCCSWFVVPMLLHPSVTVMIANDASAIANQMELTLSGLGALCIHQSDEYYKVTKWVYLLMRCSSSSITMEHNCQPCRHAVEEEGLNFFSLGFDGKSVD